MSALRFCLSLKGVFGFPVTPFGRDLSLNLDALGANVDRMAAHPFCALVAAGGMGEFFSLTPSEIEEVVRVSVDAAARRMPVIAGTGINAAVGADIARRAERAGADALLVLPPAYANAPEAGLAAYYESIAHATELPLILYSREWAVFTPEQVLRLCERVPSIGGWKDGQSDLRPLHRLMSTVGDRLAWFGGAGDDYAAEYRATGVQGYTSSLSNFAPKLSIALWNAGEIASLLHRCVYPIWSIRARMRGYEVAVTKAAMELLGITAGPVRPPLANMRPEDVSDLRQLLENRGPFE